MVLALIAGAVWRLTGHGAVIPRDGSWDTGFVVCLLLAVAIDGWSVWTYWKAMA